MSAVSSRVESIVKGAIRTIRTMRSIVSISTISASSIVTTRGRNVAKTRHETRDYLESGDRQATLGAGCSTDVFTGVGIGFVPGFVLGGLAPGFEIFGIGR